MGDGQERNVREENIRSQSTPPNPNGKGEMVDGGGGSGAVKKATNPYPYPNPAESKIPYPNPPETTLPDAATLRDQWRFAIRQYSKWYSHAWGTAILAGAAFFALGWVVKGSNPLPSFHQSHDTPPPHTNNSNSNSPSPSPSENPTPEDLRLMLPRNRKTLRLTASRKKH